MANRIYRMNRKEYQGLLETAKEQVPMGVYAIEREGYAELRNDICTSKTKLKDTIRIFKSQALRYMQTGGDPDEYSRIYATASGIL